MTVEQARAKLNEYRVAIDDIDRRIVSILNERTQIVECIGRVKREADLPVYEPRREDLVYANIAAANHGPISQEAVHRIFERIIDEMRGIQRDRMKQQGEPSC
ncbi:MAG TPA: chorismate mutase [Bryobacteraceae bacterium]|jgi:chorismate mutase-like protein|nr:chorismate mutase [Bryobacteraceae bacterium]